MIPPVSAEGSGLSVVTEVLRNSAALKASLRSITTVTSGRLRTLERVQMTAASLPGREPELIRHWQLTLRPSTAKVYTQALLQVRPELRKLTEVRTLETWGRKEATLRKVTPARPIGPADMAALIRNAPTEVGGTLLLMWVTASRHADLGKSPWVRESRMVWRQDLDVFKSDPSGKRRVTRYAWIQECPSHLADYRIVNGYLRSKGWSTYSVRRGAMTALASAGVSMEEIRLISLHAPTEDPFLAVRRYIEPHVTQPECQRQIALSRALWGMVLQEPRLSIQF